MTAQTFRRFVMQFAKCEDVALIRTEFTHEFYAPAPLVTVRGKHSGANPGAKPFQWSPAVRALTGYLVRCAAWSRRERQEVPNKAFPCDHDGRASAKYPRLEGVRPSAASSVLDALNAQVNWVCDMFGSDREGTPHLRRLLHWSNPTGRAGEPVSLCLNEKRLCPCRLQVMIGNDQVNEPQALDTLAEKIERTLRPNGRIPTPKSLSGRTGIEIRIRGDLHEFVAKRGVEELLKILKEHEVRDVQIIRVESGSIKLTLSLPEDEAERLFSLVDSGALDRFGLLDFHYVPLEHEVPATISGFDLEGYHSYLVQRARFLLGDLGVPVELDAEELASETLRAAYGTAETAVSRDVTRTEQLALLEKIQDRLLLESLGTLNIPPGEVHWIPQETDPYQAMRKVPTSGESSEEAALPGEGTLANLGIGQRSARQTTDPLTADFVPVDDKAPPNLPGYEILMPPIGEPASWPKMGGMGVVWRARDLQFQRLLAVKVMKAGSGDSLWVRYFLREARITAQLAHPSIVSVHAMGQLADGRPYYTMKLVEGKTLAEILQAEPDVPSRPTELLEVFARVCQALAFAHRKGAINRDLKPGNIMVGEHGEVQVIDWGLAKFLAEKDVLPAEAAQTNESLDESNYRTRKGQWLGTLPYMPPEQANGQIDKVDRRSDVFGLGAILCEILTGRPPYGGPTKEDVIRQAQEADLAGAHARLEACGADAELIALARACLSAEPNNRPEDASVVEKRLTGYLASVQERLRQAERDRAAAEAQAKQAVLTQQEAEKARRRMLWGTASAGLFLVALLAAGFFAWRDHDARQMRLADTIDRALTAAMGGDLKAAEQATEEAERVGASPGQVSMLRGQIALHRGESQKAMRYLKHAVQLLPDSVAAQGMLAAAYASDGDWEGYAKTITEMEKLSPSTAEDFLFKGYAEANLDPERGLQTIQKAFDRRPMMGIALLLRAEVRAFLAQDTDDLEEAEGAVQDAKYAKELLRDNPAALWVSLEAHLAKAGVHEHRGEPEQRCAELELAGEDADALEPFTALPEAVVYRWLYFREVDREKEALEELGRASEQTDHVYVTFCYALTLYRRGRRGDFEEALRVLEKKRGSYNDCLLPFVLAEHDYDPAKPDWQDGALKASKDYAKRFQNEHALMDSRTVLCLLGRKEEAVKASQELLPQLVLSFYPLRQAPILRCVAYNAGELTADELVKAAKGSRWDQCLTHYHVAMTKLAEGDRKGAQEHFEKVVKTRAFIWGAYDMSWVFQARLEKDRNWPPWIPPRRAK